MNLSNTVTRIKLNLGLMAFSSIIENLDETIVTILQSITIPDFSIFSPVKESLTINTNDLELLEKSAMYSKYLLPDFINRKLLYVFDVRYDASILSGLGYYGGGMPLLEGNLIDQMMLANAGATLMNQMIPKLTFKWEEPRSIYIYNAYSSSKIVVDLGFEHDTSMASIPETSRTEFMELALLDVKANLYPTIKYYSQLNTAVGNIDLKLEDWQNAEEQRRELMNRYSDSYHLDFQPVYYV